MIPLVRAMGKRRAVAGPIVSDAFTRADSASSMGTADTGQTWTYPSGTWGISSNKAYASTASNSAGASVDTGINPSTSGGFVEVGVTLTAPSGFTTRFPVVFLGAGSGVSHRATWRMYVDGSSSTLRIQDATGTNAAGTGLSMVSGDRISLRAYAAVGGNCLLSGRLNGVEVVTLTLPARTGTYAGIGTGSTTDSDIRFDDFSVTQ